MTVMSMICIIKEEEVKHFTAEIVFFTILRQNYDSVKLWIQASGYILS